MLDAGACTWVFFSITGAVVVSVAMAVVGIVGSCTEAKPGIGYQGNTKDSVGTKVRGKKGLLYLQCTNKRAEKLQAVKVSLTGANNEKKGERSSPGPGSGVTGWGASFLCVPTVRG